MRRFAPLAVFSAALLVSACSTDLMSPEGNAKETQVIIASAPNASCTVSPLNSYIVASIDSLMKVLTPNNSSGQSKWQQVLDAIAANDPVAAQAALDNLIDFINLKYGQANTSGVMIKDPVTGQLVPIADFKTKLFLDMQCYVDKNTFDLNPNDPAKVFVDQVTSAGVYFPAGFVPQGYNVEITTPTSPPLNTPLDQYPSFIDIKLVDANGNEPPVGTAFTGTPVVAVCFPAGLPDEVADRLLLGHEARTGFELLPKVSIPQDLAAALTCGDNLQVALSPAERMLRKAADWLLPQKAYAAFFAFGGVGGSPEEFSPFGATDPQLAFGGAGGSPEEFAPVMLGPTALTPVPNPNNPALPANRTTGQVGTTATGPSVTVQTPGGDADGANPIPGAVVTFTIDPANTFTPAGNAKFCAVNGVSPASVTVTTGANGIAAGPCIDFGTAAGYSNLKAEVDVSDLGPGYEDVNGNSLIELVYSDGDPLTVDPAGTFVNFLVEATAGAAAALTIETQPSATVQAGIAFPVQPVIQLRDANGNEVLQAGVTVTAEIATGLGSTAGGTTAQTDANGVATFSGLRIDGVLGLRTIKFTSGSLAQAVSGDVAVTAGTAAALKMVGEPATSWVAGLAPTTQPSVQVVDAWGNAVAASATVAAALATGNGTLAGTLGVDTDANGLAQFTDLRIDGVIGGRTLKFTSTGLAEVTSTTSITVTPGAAARLVMVNEPSSSAAAGVAFANQPSVKLQDAWGNDVTAQQLTVTAAITSGGAPALAGTMSVLTSSGVASFTGLRIDGATGSRTLTFTSGSLTAAVSSAIDITAGAATVVQTYMPTSAPVAAASYSYGANLAEAAAVSDAPQVRVTDTWGNPVDGATVNWSPLSAANGAVAVVGTGGTTSGGGLARITSWTLGAGANQLNAEIAGSTTPAVFTASTPTGQSLFACTVGGSKIDIAGMSFPKVSGTVREITLYLSITGQSSTEATYNANLVVRKNSATGDSVGGLTNGGITLPGNNGSPRAVTLRLSDPVFATETAGTGPNAVNNLWFNLTFTNLPSTRKIQVWYNNSITKSNQGPCYSSIVYTGTSSTVAKRGLGINVTN